MLLVDEADGMGLHCVRARGACGAMSFRKRFVRFVTLGEKCQRLLTVFQIRKVGAGGGVPDGSQRRVDLERLGKELGAIGSEVVAGDAAAGVGGTKVSAADTFPN